MTIPQIIGVLIIAAFTRALTVHKCCSIDQELFKGVCANRNKIISDFDWFPFSALFNRTSQQPMDSAAKTRVKDWMLNSSVDVDRGPYQQFYEHISYVHEDDKYTSPNNFKIFVSSSNEIEVLYNVHPNNSITHEIDDTFMVSVDDVCFDKNRRNKFVVLFPISKVFVHKCCQYGFWWSYITESCTPITDPTVDIHRDWRPYGLQDTHDVVVPKWYNYCQTYRRHEPQNKYNCRGHLEPEIFLNGSIKIKNVIYNKFCWDVTQQPDGSIEKHDYQLCLPEFYKKPGHHPVQTYGVLFLTGGVLMLLTVAISMYLPQLRQRLHNKIAITHNSVLMLVHFIWGSQFFKDDSSNNNGCSIRILLIQFLFLASLFWLNVLCINMSSTFRTTRTISSRSAKSETRRYLVYSLYAWGAPAVISLITISMEFAEHTPFGFERPGFKCFCNYTPESLSIFYYLYGPMTVLLAFNLVLYSFTTWKIISVSRQTDPFLKRKESSISGGTFQTDVQKLALYTKLFFIMGVTWSMEIVNWAANLDGSAFSIMCDILNISRPIFIFIIFICKKPILISLYNKVRSDVGLHIHESDRSTATEGVSGLSCSRRPSNQDDVHYARKISHDRSRRPSNQDNTAGQKTSQDRTAMFEMLLKPIKPAQNANLHTSDSASNDTHEDNLSLHLQSLF